MAKCDKFQELMYKLILNENEIKFLIDVLNNIGGSHITTRRKYAEQILEAIDTQVNDYEGDNSDMLNDGKIGIFFKENV